MLSRVADSIYWMNRYVERAENIARFVDVNLNLLLDTSSIMAQQWLPLILTTGGLKEFEDRYGEATQENVIQFLTFDRAYGNSIISCLCSARENARSIREIISSEMWEQINDFYFLVQSAAQKPQDSLNWSDFFTTVKMASHLFNGITAATMTRNEGWHFGQMGRYLERADKTSRILDVKYFILLPSAKDVGTTLDDLQWMSLLKSVSAYEMYRKSSHRRIDPTSVAEFLLLDRQFPRSIWFCIQSAEKSLHQITGTPLGAWGTPIERHFGKVRSDLDYTAMDEVIQTGLHEFLDGLQSRLNDLDHQIFDSFLAIDSIAA
jgi:uncharacterized alpha-E superfamily protein